MPTNTPPPPIAEPAPTPLWRNISFVLMWSSVAASGFGDRIIMLTALTLMGVAEWNVQSTSVQAGINFFFFLPYLLLGVPAGWLADRLPRKWIMLTCDEFRAILLLLAFALVPATGVAAIPNDHHWKVLAVIFAVGIFAALFNPARNATIPQIVPLKQLQSCNALIIGIAVIASLIGLAVGGLMIDPMEAASVRTGLIVGAVFYGVSGTFFAFLRIRKRHTAVGGIDFGPVATKALRHVLSHGTTWRLILINTLMWGMAMVVYNGTVGLCKTQYGLAGDQVLHRYTIMGMMIGLGMLSGAMWVAWMNTRRESASVAMAAMLAASVCTAALALNRSYGVGLVFAFCVGFFGNTTIICAVTLIQTITPNHVRGRVMGIYSLITTIATIAINLLIWRMARADTVIIPTMRIAAAGMAAVAFWGLYQMTHGPAPTPGGNVLWRLTRLYVLVWHRLEWCGRHHVPRTGPVIIVPNHTAGIDPLLIQAAVPRVMRWVMLRRHRYWWLSWIWRVVQPIALARNGSDVSRARQMLKALNAGDILGFFPEGGLQSRRNDLKPFARGIGFLAVRSGAPIVPVWIEGTPPTRRIFWHFLRPSRSRITFGAPYRPPPGDYETIASDLRERLLRLSCRAG